MGIPALYFYAIPPFYHIDGGDSWPVIPTAASLVQQGNFELSEYSASAPIVYFSHEDGYYKPYCILINEKGLYSRYPVGMTLPALPVVAVSALCGANFIDEKVVAAIDRWAGMLMAVLVLITFFRLALTIATPRAALATTAILALASTVFTVIAQSMWQHGGVVLGLELILLVEFEPRFRKSWGWRIVQGFIAGWMFACRLNSGLLLLFVGLWILLRDPKRGVIFGLLGIASMLPWMLLYWNIYGSPLGPSSQQTAAGLWVSFDIWNWLGVLISPGRGFFVFQFWVVLGIAALWLKNRSIAETPPHPQPLSRQGRGEIVGWPILCWIAILGQSVMLAVWWCWWGGSGWASRLMTDVLPFAGLLALPAVERMVATYKGRWLLGLFTALCMLPHLPPFWQFPLTQPWNPYDEKTFWLLPQWK